MDFQGIPLLYLIITFNKYNKLLLIDIYLYWLAQLYIGLSYQNVWLLSWNVLDKVMWLKAGRDMNVNHHESSVRRPRPLEENRVWNAMLNLNALGTNEPDAPGTDGKTLPLNIKWPWHWTDTTITYVLLHIKPWNQGHQAVGCVCGSASACLYLFVRLICSLCKKR